MIAKMLLEVAARVGAAGGNFVDDGTVPEWKARELMALIERQAAEIAASHATIATMHDRFDELEANETLDALADLVTDVENKWGDPHTLRHAKDVLASARARAGSQGKMKPFFMCGSCRGDLAGRAFIDRQKIQCPHCGVLLWFEVRSDGHVIQHPGGDELDAVRAALESAP